MHVFGKLTGHTETIVDELTGGSVNIIIFRNYEGRDWLRVAEDNPYPYYIAIDDNNQVVSVATDPSKLQIDRYVIIGLTSSFGYSFDDNSNAIGATWNGEKLIDTDPIVSSVSKRQFLLYSALKGYITQDDALAVYSGVIPSQILEVLSWMKLSPDELFAAKMAFLGSNIFKKDHPLIVKAADSIGWTSLDLDIFWLEASKL